MLDAHLRLLQLRRQGAQLALRICSRRAIGFSQHDYIIVVWWKFRPMSHGMERHKNDTDTE